MNKKFNNNINFNLIILIISGFFLYGTSKNISDIPSQHAYEKREFSVYESPLISPDQNMLAYCITHKAYNPFNSTEELALETPISKLGSRIYITNLDSKNSFEIGPSNANNWLPSWSPDSSKLAFFSDANGKPEQWLYDLKENKSISLSSIRIRSDIGDLGRSIWSSEGKNLYVRLVPPYMEKELENTRTNPKKVRVCKNKKNLKTNIGNNYDEIFKNLRSKFYSSDLAVIDVVSKQVKIIVPSTLSESFSFMQLSPTGNWLNFSCLSQEHEKNICIMNHDLHVMNLETGNKQLIEKNISSLYEQLNYLWHPNEDKIFFIKEGKLFLAELDKDKFFQKKQLGTVNNLVGAPFIFSNNGKNILVGASNEDIEDTTELFYISIDSGDTKKIILPDESRFKSVIKCDTNRLWEPEDNTFIYHAVSAKNTDLLISINIDHNNILNESILWQSSASISHITPLKNNSFIAIYEDFNTSQNLYTLNKNFSLKEKVITLNPQLDYLNNFSKKTITTSIKLQDGKTKNVNTTILLPNNYKKIDNLPALVIFYPGCYSSSLIKKFAGGDLIGIPNHLFLNAGFVLILPDVPTGADGEPGNPIQEMVDIILPQIHHANKLGYLNLNRLGILGHSYGGYGVASIISKTSLFKAAVAISGIFDLPGSYGYLGRDNGSFNKSWSEDGQGRMGTHPWKDLQRYLENSPYYLAAKINTPLLLIHGEKDTICNFVEAEKMFSAMRRLDKDVELAIYPNQEHSLLNWEDNATTDAYKRIIKFLKDYLTQIP